MSLRHLSNYREVCWKWKPETVHRRMSETVNHLMGWPTHVSDGHNHYTVEDLYWRIGSLDIKLENQRKCTHCDENQKEYITDTVNLMSHIDITLKHMRTAVQGSHEQGSMKMRHLQDKQQGKHKGKHTNPTGQSLRTKFYNK